MKENIEKIEKKTVIKSLFWKLFERVGVQGVQFVLSIILARLVEPSSYGTIALLLIFTQFADVFIQGGLNTALIQKKDSDDLDFSSTFFLSLGIAGIFYILLFFLAPYVSLFFKQPELSHMLRVLASILFFGSFNSIQIAFVSRTMQFNKLFFSSVGAVVGAGSVGIVLAYNGFGSWALVWQQLIAAFLTTVILWATVKWRPRFQFSIVRIKELFSFGVKLLFANLISVVFENIYSIVIGKRFDSSMLGFYKRGQQFPAFIAKNLDGSIQSVLFPTLSSYKDDTVAVKKITRRSISLSSFLLCPLMFGLAALAKPVVLFLLGEKWLPCVFFLQIGCISYSFFPIHTANLSAINALGRSDLYLRLEIIKKIVTVFILLVTIPLGIKVMAVGQLVSLFVSTFINAFPNKELLKYPYFEQIKDIFIPFSISFVMFIFLGFVNLNQIGTVFEIIIKVLFGAAFYVLFSYALKSEAMLYLINNAKKIIAGRKR